MDKEKLLAYFQEHYLSRQEVLFKLPLNLTIDAFWPDLLNRRKSKGTILPLYNASGMPYWYVLTPKMIAASERLSEEAIAQDNSFDPYRVEMTSAMTEEMFFTSFVEGAQIPLQEAMDFLSRGTEPESVQEQMIWNNRHAWSEMVSGLYRPLDEAFVKGLAWMLTEEMDGCAEDYRQVDNHPIAAMNNEPYDLPPAYSLPERMNQYYAFLRQPDIHPLIKAAVSQAYLLVTRPFPEGNERLSRMMSSAVLLRCGYDFFRDISISSVIARENYRYYKAMCDIIRTENGGDLTYFIEYYLELLVRALDDRKERLRRRQQENLEKEREMAAQPLKPLDRPSEDQAQTGAEQPVPVSQAGTSPEGGEDALVIGEHVPLDQYLAGIDKMKHSPNAKARQTPALIREMLSSGQYTFTVKQWAERSQQETNLADAQCRYLFQKGLLDRDKRGPIMTYTFRVTQDEGKISTKSDSSDDEEHPTESIDSSPAMTPLLNWIGVYAKSNEQYKRNVAAYFQKMISRSTAFFTSKDLALKAGLSTKQAKTICSYLVRRHMVINTSPTVKPTVFQLAGMNANNPPPQPGSPADMTISINSPEKAQQPEAPAQCEIQAALQRMLQSKSEIMRHAGEVIKQMAEQGKTTFMRRDWPAITGLSKGRANDTCDLMMKHGIIKNESPGQLHAVYKINLPCPSSEQSPAMIPESKLEELAALSSAVQESRIKTFLASRIKAGQTQFSSNEWKAQFDLAKSTCNNDLRIAEGLGLITKIGKTPDRYDIYVINQSPAQSIRTDGLTPRQIQCLQAIYDAFGNKQFTVYDCAPLLDQQPSSVGYYLKLYVNRGILAMKKKGFERAFYSLQITPATHPDCFISSNISAQATTIVKQVPMAASGQSRMAVAL